MTMQSSFRQSSVFKLAHDQFPYFVLAFLVAGVWLFFSKDLSSYNQGFWTFRGFNLFPLTAWLYYVYIFLEQILIDKVNHSFSFWKRFSIFVLVYVVFLISFESFGYHVLDIKNQATSQYSGLPFCDCIHAPLWMQISYFMLGPIYFMLCEFWRYLKKSA